MTGPGALNLLDPNLFNNTGSQFTPEDNIYNDSGDGGIVEVTNLTTALTALQEIVTQGKGKPCDGLAKDEGQQNHCDIFLGLK